MKVLHTIDVRDFNVVWPADSTFKLTMRVSDVDTGAPFYYLAEMLLKDSAEALILQFAKSIGGTTAGVIVHGVWDFSGATVTGVVGVRPITIGFDGGGSTLVVGATRYVYVPYACTISAVVVDAQNETGSIVLDLWVDVIANFPPTVADTITASAKPTLSAAKVSRDATLTGWSKSVAAGSYIACRIESVTGLTKVQLTLEVQP